MIVVKLCSFLSDLQLYSVKYAMIDQLRNPCPEFEEVIRTHFYLKKDRILEVK